MFATSMANIYVAFGNKMRMHASRKPFKIIRTGILGVSIIVLSYTRTCIVVVNIT